ncbi:hypothetical protein AsFPU1_3254 [Aphanothece sacrum FPU1]|uniref:Cofactor assembly of complex C subunit B n=2 Tax=Aphanothece sacrum TaxID=1122 RepID=A0A401IKR0_APHSA|nr:hypothetical protein AsFPU1_3254 [Aphanothece sacrum FPU1]GBF85652.1 hypothetical protein AsFPU3_2716 [Aphanothece sacrum FPU3]
MQFSADIAPINLLSQLQTYFTQKAYKITAVDPQKQQITFDGFVRPSWFLAIFLSFLAAVGLFCLGLVLSFLYPTLTPIFLGLSLLSPLTGVFYWKQAGRIEQLYLSVAPQESASQTYTVVTVTAHRDELIQLQETLPILRKISVN